MYITGLKTISPQPTFDESLFQGNYTMHSGNKYRALEPDYTGLISPNLLRRMGRSIRMGIGAGFPLMQSQDGIDAIILGSSEGGQEDSIKFLNQIVAYNEGTLTPTNFVQSTPNALAGSLALMSRNRCYNITHVHKGLAFENSLIDALLLFSEGKANTILAGNVEEISEFNFNIDTIAGQFKTEETTSENLLTSNTPGTVCGEGSSMFILQAYAREYFARIIEVEQISYPVEHEIHDLIMSILEKNDLTPDDIDALILGYNGDNRTDFWYTNITESIFPRQGIYTYKNMVGEYPTSIAFATYMAAHLLSGRNVPVEPLKQPGKPIKHILIYNHYKGVQHGLILLSS
ncbi:MAG: beta-ketoacyl synthase chain length factor [Bacteroidia bacterium]|nr:beta-ketoacyl synthase chain length factor [Bacteroidia bacterium]